MDADKVRVTVRPELTFEQAEILRQLINMGLQGSASALEVLPSVEAKTRLVERRAHFMDLQDLLQDAVYRATLEQET